MCFVFILKKFILSIFVVSRYKVSVFSLVIAYKNRKLLYYYKKIFVCLREAKTLLISFFFGKNHLKILMESLRALIESLRHWLGLGHWLDLIATQYTFYIFFFIFIFYLCSSFQFIISFSLIHCIRKVFMLLSCVLPFFPRTSY